MFLVGSATEACYSKRSAPSARKRNEWQSLLSSEELCDIGGMSSYGLYLFFAAYLLLLLLLGRRTVNQSRRNFLFFSKSFLGWTMWSSSSSIDNVGAQPLMQNASTTTLTTTAFALGWSLRCCRSPRSVGLTPYTRPDYKGEGV